VDRLSVQTLYFSRYISLIFSSTHHNRAVAINMSRITVALQISLCYRQQQREKKNSKITSVWKGYVVKHNYVNLDVLMICLL